MSNGEYDLVVSIGIEIAAFKKGMDNAENSIKNAVNRITKALKPLQVAKTVRKAFNSYIGSSDAIGKFADSIGESVSVVDAWGLAVRQAGGIAEDLQSTIDTLASGLNQVATTGKGHAKEGLAAFGISATDASGKAKKATDLLMELAGKAETMSKEQFRGLAQALGIDKGTIMLLQQGKKSVQELVKEMEGMAITEEDAEVAAEFNTAWQNLSTSFQRVAAILFRALTPALTKITKVFTGFVNLLRDNEQFVLLFFAGLAAVLTYSVIPAFKKWALAVWANPLTWIVAAIIVGLIAVALIIDDIITYFRGGDSVIGRFFETISKIFEDLSWENLKAEFQAAIQAFKDLWTELKVMVGRIIDWIGDKVQVVIDFIKDLVQQVTDAINWIAESKLGKAVGTIGGVIRSGAEWLVGGGNAVKEDLNPALTLSGGANRTGQNISADNNVQVDTIIIHAADATARGIAGGVVGALSKELPRQMANRAGSSVKAY